MREENDTKYFNNLLSRNKPQQAKNIKFVLKIPKNGI